MRIVYQEWRQDADYHVLLNETDGGKVSQAVASLLNRFDAKAPVIVKNVLGKGDLLAKGFTFYGITFKINSRFSMTVPAPNTINVRYEGDLYLDMRCTQPTLLGDYADPHVSASCTVGADVTIRMAADGSDFSVLGAKAFVGPVTPDGHNLVGDAIVAIVKFLGGLNVFPPLTQALNQGFQAELVSPLNGALQPVRDQLKKIAGQGYVKFSLTSRGKEMVLTVTRFVVRTSGLGQVSGTIHIPKETGWDANRIRTLQVKANAITYPGQWADMGRYTIDSVTPTAGGFDLKYTVTTLPLDVPLSMRVFDPMGPNLNTRSALAYWGFSATGNWHNPVTMASGLPAKLPGLPNLPFQDEIIRAAGAGASNALRKTGIDFQAFKAYKGPTLDKQVVKLTPDLGRANRQVNPADKVTAVNPADKVTAVNPAGKVTSVNPADKITATQKILTQPGIFKISSKQAPAAPAPQNVPAPVIR